MSPKRSSAAEGHRCVKALVRPRGLPWLLPRVDSRCREVLALLSPPPLFLRGRPFCPTSRPVRSIAGGWIESLPAVRLAPAGALSLPISVAVIVPS